jgi:O-antigen/teichoic acid export membrane protein
MAGDMHDVPEAGTDSTPAGPHRPLPAESPESPGPSVGSRDFLTPRTTKIESFLHRRQLWLRPRKMVRRISWGIADQGMSSLTNFAVAIYVVHTLGAAQFGAFSVAYVTYAVALNASRGLSTDPLMVRFSAVDDLVWRRAVPSCTGTALCVGLATGACVVSAAALLSGPLRLALLALGLTLPGLMLQDSWRYCFFAIGRGSQAFLNDSIWAGVLVPTLVLLRLSGHANVFWFTLAWGVGATVGAVIGPLQAHMVPRITQAWSWLVHHRDLGPRYLAEGVSNAAAGQVRSYGIALMLGLAPLGYVQAANTLTGPVTILYLGMALVAIPESARVLRRSPRHLPTFCVLVSSGLAAGALGWGVFLLIAVPRGLGAIMIGGVWRQTYPLLLPQTIFLVGQAASGGAGAGMHALGAARRSLRTMVVASILLAVMSIAGAAVGGPSGAIEGTAVAAWLGAIMAWWQLRLSLREAATKAGDGRVASPPAPLQSAPALAIAAASGEHAAATISIGQALVKVKHKLGVAITGVRGRILGFIILVGVLVAMVAVAYRAIG